MTLLADIGLALALVLLGVAGGFLFFCRTLVFFFIYPKRPAPTSITGFMTQCRERLPDPERLRITTGDGCTLSTLWFPHPDPTLGAALVLCHGSTSYKEELLNLACEAFSRGYSVCVFDFRRHGASTGHASTIGLDEVQDIKAVLATIRALSGIRPERVGLLGHSMGAAAVLNYLADYDDETPFGILLAPFASLDRALFNRLRRFRVPAGPTRWAMVEIAKVRLHKNIIHNAPLNIVGSIRETTLCYIHGQLDRGNHPSDSQDLFDQTRVPKELHWIADVDHHGIIQHPEAIAIVGDFLGRQLAPWQDVLLSPPEAQAAYVSPAASQNATRPR